MVEARDCSPPTTRAPQKVKEGPKSRAKPQPFLSHHTDQLEGTSLRPCEADAFPCMQGAGERGCSMSWCSPRGTVPAGLCTPHDPAPDKDFRGHPCRYRHLGQHCHGAGLQLQQCMQEDNTRSSCSVPLKKRQASNEAPEPFINCCFQSPNKCDPMLPDTWSRGFPFPFPTKPARQVPWGTDNKRSLQQAWQSPTCQVRQD